MKHIQTMASIGVMVAGALWGLLWFPLAELEKHGLGVGLSSTIFYAVTALCAVPGLLFNGAWRQIAMTPLSCIIMGTAFTLYTFALLLTHPLNAILLFYLTPVWSILLAKAFYGEAIGILRGAVVIMGFVGVGLVLGVTSLPIPKNLGDWIALLSGALWALGTSLTVREQGKNSWVGLMQFSVAGLASTAVLALALSAPAPKVLAASTSIGTSAAAVAVGLVLFAIPNLLVIWATSHLSSTRVGVLLMMEVVVGTLAVALLSANPVANMQIIGATLIFAAGVTEVISRDSHAAANSHV